MNIITGIVWRGYTVPFRKPFVTAGFTAENRTGLLVFIRTNLGLIGVGEASPVGAGSLPEVETIAAALNKIAPRLLDLHLNAADKVIVEGLPAPLAFGLETSLRDIRAREAGVSLTTLLGGRPSPVAVNALVIAESPETAAVEAAAAVESGFKCVKLKVGKNPVEKDTAVVAAVREVVGPQVFIRLDANQAWDVEQAVEAIKVFSRYNIEFIEQPVAAADIAGMAQVRNSSRIPLAADESLGSYMDMHRLLDSGAADVFVIKCARLGGFSKSRIIAREIIERGHRVVVTSSLESGIGIAAAAHFAASLPPQPKAHGLATAALLESDLLESKWHPEDGCLSVPDKPGLGFEVDPVLLKKYGSGLIGSAGSRAGLDLYLASDRSSK